MRRQLIVAMVAVVTGALLVAGVGTYLLANRGARADAARALLQDARKAKNDIPTLLNVDSLRLRRDLLSVVQSAAGARLVVLTPQGVLTGALPPQVSAQDLQPLRLAKGMSISGVTGDTAYAALPLSGLSVARVYPSLGTSSASSTLVLVVVRDYHGAGLGGRYLLTVSAVTLLAASLVAWVLGRRITRPLAASVGAIGRIAHGDLTARVPNDGTRYPELSSLADSINTMTANLARSRESERQFLLSVSHELRTPLTSILGYAEALTDGTVVDSKRAAAVMAAEARRLDRLVRDLLELARLDTRQFSLHVGRAEVLEIATDTAEGFRPLFEDADLELHVRLPVEGGWWALADPDRLAQVLANLVENAYKFASRSVIVSGWADPSRVVLTVEDDGPGIPSTELSRVFERHYQVPRSPARQAGSGVGLAIVSELVAAMSGTVRAVSPVSGSRGTRMEIGLPAWAAGTEETPATPMTAGAEPRPPAMS